ncbi:MAG: hypothetical protein ACLSVD_19685, partial [Eggerthellaceae bacterium]
MSDAKYDAPTRPTGMGNALLKLGKSAEAGVAFGRPPRRGQPDHEGAPTWRVLMALDRRPTPWLLRERAAVRHAARHPQQAYANLGQAYVACGQMQKAVNAFDESIADKTYYLSDSASVDYQRAIAAVAQGTSEITQVIQPLPSAADMSGLDVAADGTAVYVDQDPYAGAQDPYYYADPYAQPGPYGASESEDRFFNASDEELEQWSRGLAKQDRKRRNVGLKIVIVVFVLLLLAFGAAVFLYTQGWGYPTQETVV